MIIYQENGTVILKPLTNWNGQETLTFFASDNVFDEVYDSVEINVIPQNDPPGPAKILTPKTGHRIKEKTPIDFTSYCDDPDIQYGDEITFKWYSNISNGLGEGKTLEDIILPVGKHLITLEVSDRDGETSTATITVSVVETPETDSDCDGIPNVWERKYKLNLSDPADAHNDSDGDGLSNIKEYNYGTNPQKSVTDNDGLSDIDEINKYNTNPTIADTDADGYVDGSDEYPLDSTKWEKETPAQDNSWAFFSAIAVVVSVIILIIFLLVLRARKGKKDKKKVTEEKPADVSAHKKPTLTIKPSYQ